MEENRYRKRDGLFSVAAHTLSGMEGKDSGSSFPTEGYRESQWVDQLFVLSWPISLGVRVSGEGQVKGRSNVRQWLYLFLKF